MVATHGPGLCPWIFPLKVCESLDPCQVFLLSDWQNDSEMEEDVCFFIFFAMNIAIFLLDDVAIHAVVRS